MTTDIETLKTDGLRDRLTAALADAFERIGLERRFANVEVSNRPDLCQFQSNGAMAAAKAAKKPPREIAQAVVDALSDEWAPRFSKIEIAGPGFINLTLDDAYLAAFVSELSADTRFGVPAKADPLKVVIDFGGPNIAKPMHVGHLRSSILGDCLQNLFRFTGDDTVSDIHLGDWGLPMGMLIAAIAEQQPDLPYFAEGATGPFPTESPVTIEDLERLYPAAAAACKADETKLAAARQATAELQAGRPGYHALWQHFVDVSLATLKKEFGDLGVNFTLWQGEADVNDVIPPMVEALKASGEAEESEGALVIQVAEEADKAEIPPLILLKSDGAMMYSTTDLATIKERVGKLGADLILYVVDQRQHLHFTQVFRAAKKTGIATDTALEHIGFGTVNGPDGKPFKTRAGGVMRLGELIAMADESAGRRLAEAGLTEQMEAAELTRLARQVGIAAIKFADLSNARLSNYIFDIDRFTTFEGKTGPYLQYAAVRINSIMRRVEEEGAFAPGPVHLGGEAERALALALCEFPSAIASAYSKRAPHFLCEFAFSLAQAFSRFYTEHHILRETDEALRASRLSLAQMTQGQLTLILGLLGLPVPDRM